MSYHHSSHKSYSSQVSFTSSRQTSSDSSSRSSGDDDALSRHLSGNEFKLLANERPTMQNLSDRMSSFLDKGPMQNTVMTNPLSNLRAQSTFHSLADEGMRYAGHRSQMQMDINPRPDVHQSFNASLQHHDLQQYLPMNISTHSGLQSSESQTTVVKAYASSMTQTKIERTERM